MKAAGRKITMLTAYDYTTAALVDSTGVEGILVGDSMSMVVQGHDTTLPVTLDEMIYHAEMVGRAVRHALGRRRHAVSDRAHLGPHKAVENAGRMLKETRCQAVKLEGGAEQAEVIACPRIGRHSRDGPLRAASAERASTGGLQGAARRAAIASSTPRRLKTPARSPSCSNAFRPSSPRRLTERLKIPTIGIGAGVDCDGQVLVINDLLGLTAGQVPRFVKPYANLRSVISEAVTQFRDEVREGKFPGPDQQFK